MSNLSSRTAPLWAVVHEDGDAASWQQDPIAAVAAVFTNEADARGFADRYAEECGLEATEDDTWANPGEDSSEVVHVTQVGA